MKYRWLIVDIEGNVVGTNNQEAVDKVRTDEYSTVIDVDLAVELLCDGTTYKVHEYEFHPEHWK